MLVSPVAFDQREWPAGSKSFVITTEPSIPEDRRLLLRLQLVYPLAIPPQRISCSDAYPPGQDHLGKEKSCRLQAIERLASLVCSVVCAKSCSSRSWEHS